MEEKTLDELLEGRPLFSYVANGVEYPAIKNGSFGSYYVTVKAENFTLLKPRWEILHFSNDGRLAHGQGRWHELVGKVRVTDIRDRCKSFTPIWEMNISKSGVSW